MRRAKKATVATPLPVTLRDVVAALTGARSESDRLFGVALDALAALSPLQRQHIGLALIVDGSEDVEKLQFTFDVAAMLRKEAAAAGVAL